MTRGTFVWDAANACLIPKEEWLARKPAPKRSHLPSPAFARDCIETQSMADGKIYTSKAALRRSYREQGFVEVGDDPARHKQKARPKSDRRAIKDTVQKAFVQAGLPAY